MLTLPEKIIFLLAALASAYTAYRMAERVIKIIGRGQGQGQRGKRGEGGGPPRRGRVEPTDAEQDPEDGGGNPGERGLSHPTAIGLRGLAVRGRHGPQRLAQGGSEACRGSG